MVRPEQHKLVLDTSLFSNPDTQHYLGTGIHEAVERFVSIAREHSIELYMPSSIFNELRDFAPEETLTLFKREAVIRSPDLYRLQIPAVLVHSFIQELRNRVDKGLRIAERAIREENAPDNIHRLRDKYRTALRGGIVDSVEDFEVILMAMELKGSVLSSDQGIINMAESLGIEVLSAPDFLNLYHVERHQEE
jgi:hypothetical protein